MGGLNPHFQNSVSHAINDAGHVVGVSYAEDWSGWHAFSWKDHDHNNASDPGEMVDLGHLGGDSGHNNSYAEGISQKGQYVVGNSLNEQGVWRAFRWNDADDNHAVDPGEITALAPLGSQGECRALGVNDSGQVVGWYAGADRQHHAFLWTDTLANGVEDPGEPIEVGDLDDGLPVLHSEARAINNAGQVVGYTANEAWHRAFRFQDNGNNQADPGEAQDLGTFFWDVGMN